MPVRTKLEKILFRVLRLPTCEEVEEFAYDFLEGNLDAATQRKVAKHLKLCLPCVKFMESYRKAKAAGSLEEVPPLDPKFKEELFEFLKKNPQTH